MPARRMVPVRPTSVTSSRLPSQAAMALKVEMMVPGLLVGGACSQGQVRESRNGQGWGVPGFWMQEVVHRYLGRDHAFDRGGWAPPLPASCRQPHLPAQ
jgi:hypothetical protein